MKKYLSASNNYILETMSHAPEMQTNHSNRTLLLPTTISKTLLRKLHGGDVSMSMKHTTKVTLLIQYPNITRMHPYRLLVRIIWIRFLCPMCTHHRTRLLFILPIPGQFETSDISLSLKFISVLNHEVDWEENSCIINTHPFCNR